MVHVLRDIGLDVTRVSRNPTADGDVAYSELSAAGVAAVPLIVNCTPVGMHPQVKDMPPFPMGPWTVWEKGTLWST